MKLIQIWFLFLIFFAAFLLEATPKRILSVSGATTELLYALGAGNLLVGVDSTSTFPKAAENLPKVGYMRTLSAEGLLSFQPDLVIGTSEAGPAHTWKQLEELSLRVVLVPETFRKESLFEKIKLVAEAIDKQKEGEILSKKLKKEFQNLKLTKSTKRILFLYARNPSTIFVSGIGTAPHAMIELSLAKNAINEFSDYKALTPEALAKANPDIILTTERTVQGLGGQSAIWNIPGIQLTNAGKHQRLIQMDDLMLLGFGPRLPKALQDLNQFWNENP